MTDTPPLADSRVPAAGPSLGAKLLAIGCHLSLLLGLGLGTLIPFIVWLVNRRTGNMVESHSRSALNFHLSLIIYLMIAWVALFFTIGFSVFAGMAHGQYAEGAAGISVLAVAAVILAVFATTIAVLILAVIAAIRASDGEPYRYPFTLPIFRQALPSFPNSV